MIYLYGARVDSDCSIIWVLLFSFFSFWFLIQKEKRNIAMTIMILRYKKWLTSRICLHSFFFFFFCCRSRCSFWTKWKELSVVQEGSIIHSRRASVPAGCSTACCCSSLRTHISRSLLAAYHSPRSSQRSTLHSLCHQWELGPIWFYYL